MKILWHLPLIAILAGSALAGCISSGPAPAIYDLRAAAIPAAGRVKSVQLLVAPPSAIDALATDRILVRPDGAQAISYLADSRWSDRLPNLVQARLAEAIGSAGVVKAVGRPGDSLAIDDRLLLDIQAFDFLPTPAPSVVVKFSATLMDDRSGKVKATHVFEATVATADGSAVGVAAGFQSGLDKIATDLVGWLATAL